MEKVLGKVHQELREDEAWWVVSDQGVELMALETLWRAHEWRRRTKIYRSYGQEIGIRYYMQEGGEWYVRAATARGWQKLEDREWVESACQESEALYLKSLQQ